jgi:hypothetical protein
MEKITIVIQAKKELNKVLSLLDFLEGIQLPKNYCYEVALFFNNPWLVQDFCSYSKKYENIKIFLCEDIYEWENLNVLFKNLNSKVIYVLSVETEIEKDFFFSLVNN